MILEMSHCFKVTLCKFYILRHFIFFRACLLWNGLSQSVKHSENIFELKRKLKELEKIDSSCFLRR